MGDDTLKATYSRKSYIPIYFMIIALVALISYMKYLGIEINPPALLAAVAFIVFSIAATEFHRIGESYEINSDFFVHNKGRLRKNIRKVAIQCVSDLGADQSVWQRLLNFGTVNVYAFSEGKDPIKVRNINNPKRFVKFLEETIKARRK